MTGTVLRRPAMGVLVVLAFLAGCARVPPATLDPVPPSVCYRCLWVYEDPVYSGVVQVYEGYQSDDPLVMADVGYMLARMHDDPAGYRLFEEFPGQTTFGDPRPRFLMAEEMDQGR